MRETRSRAPNVKPRPERELARPRNFDVDQAIDAAIDCFWVHGLEATSVRDLSDAMGINGPSLYHAFGDKLSLFRLALARYAERSMRERIRRLEAEPSGKRAAGRFLSEVIDASVLDTRRRGCLIVNSAIEISPHDAPMGGVIAGYLSEIEAFFRHCVSRAQVHGEVDPRVDARDAARLLLGVVLGIRVAARSRPERSLLDGMARAALTLLAPARR